MLQWLNQHHLSLPAWVLAESIRPFSWLVGQMALVGTPVAGILGVSQWEAWAEVLNDPDQYGAWCDALAEQVHRNTEEPS